ncbi:MAG TPA: flagellar biosynthesis anti-sigma factor FlgM [Acidobacteriaceae bacterium]|jgi:negative regulator of flagellin synthesis FlgM|nr:flagellar biosynthesis anti-sigma factor FlgM [Acidobacteriaceae bacterium]
MNVHNNLQGLQQLFSSQEVAGTSSGRTSDAASAESSSSADEATLSSAASAAAQAAPDSDVRMDKVAQVQKALAEGTYNVASSDVANSMIDSMLGK